MNGAGRDQQLLTRLWVAHDAVDLELLHAMRTAGCRMIAFGFESEFVGRLPVRTVLEPLDENDLYEILKNPSNPIIIGKKLDFDAYGIDVKFDDQALRLLAKDASAENTGARGLVSAVEGALLLFEKTLPSTTITHPMGTSSSSAAFLRRRTAFSLSPFC